MPAAAAWWRDAVVYQVYPRSFQDTDGDGLGDIPGVTARLGHLERLGVDAVWLSPFYPSGGADMGYDVTDFTAVDPALGTLEDVDGLVAQAHARDIRVLLDLVPGHTSIEHPWFREHPERYVWADGDEPPNNWIASFGGPAWSRDERTGRWYLHSFYPEQPDLDLSRPDVREAIADVIRFWRGRGVDGFRVDAVQGLAKDPELRDDPPASQPFPLPLHAEHAALEHVHSRDGPGMEQVLSAFRRAAGDAFLVGEVYLPTDRLQRYQRHLDLVFGFEFLHAPRDAGRLAEVIRAATELGGVAWALSNHDFPRLVTRFGPDHARATAMLLLTLPGAAFVYQGDEIGMEDGPGASPPFDRAGRDPHRHPMQWDPSSTGGFTTGSPWLEVVDPAVRNVASQRDDEGSMLSLYHRLIALRPRLGGEIDAIEASGDVLAYRRGEHRVAINLGSSPAPFAESGEVILATDPGHEPGRLEPGEGVLARRMV